MALNKTGAKTKIPAIAEKALANFPENDDLLLLMTETAMTRKQTDRALNYANRLTAVAQQTRRSRKACRRRTGSANAARRWRAATMLPACISAEKGVWVAADKNLRAALPLIQGQTAMLGPALFYLGMANYQLGKMTLNKAKMLEAVKFSEQSMVIDSPYADQARHNALVMKDEAAGCGSRFAASAYLPMQKVLKMRFRMSSAVVAPVMASMGRSAAYRSSSSISCGIEDRTASRAFSRYAADSRRSCSWRRLVMKPVSCSNTPFGRDGFEDGVAQFGDAFAGERGDGQQRRPCPRPARQIALVAHHQRPAAGARDQALVLRGERLRQIDHHQRQIGVRHRLVAALDAQRFHALRGFAECPRYRTTSPECRRWPRSRSPDRAWCRGFP